MKEINEKFSINDFLTVAITMPKGKDQGNTLLYKNLFYKIHWFAIKRKMPQREPGHNKPIS